jgi:DNA-binding NarL/FixJ family response regulator
MRRDGVISDRQRGEVVAIRIVVGEDSFLAREALAEVLRDMKGVRVVAVCGDLDGLRDAIDDEQPDVVLTDIKMPPGHSDEGIRMAAELRSSHPDIGVIILSQYLDAAYAAALFEAGSEGRAYLLKERVKDRKELKQTLDAVAAGGSVVDPLVVEHLLNARRQHEDLRLDTLTSREREILGLIAEGRSNAGIAEALVITKRAVERHINSIFMKLDLGDPRDVSRRVKATLLFLNDQTHSEAAAH